MEHSQLLVVILLVPVFLQIFFPLLLLAVATLIRVCRHLVALLSSKPERSTLADALISEKA